MISEQTLTRLIVAVFGAGLKQKVVVHLLFCRSGSLCRQSPCLLVRHVWDTDRRSAGTGLPGGVANENLIRRRIPRADRIVERKEGA